MSARTFATLPRTGRRMRYVVPLIAALAACDSPTNPGALTPTPPLRALATPTAYRITDLGVGRAGDLYSIATAISSNGFIAGLSFVSSTSPYHGFVIGGTKHDLGLSEPYLTVTGVNSSENVVGSYGPSSTATTAFIWTSGHRVVSTLAKLPGASSMAAVGINDAGQIAGCAVVSGVNHIVMWSGATRTIKDLGTGPAHQGACATAINLHGMMAVLYASGGQLAVGMYNQFGVLIPVPLPAGHVTPGDTLSLAIPDGGPPNGSVPSPSINRYGDLAVNLSATFMGCTVGGCASGFFLWTGGAGSVLQPPESDLNYVTGLNVNHLATVFAVFSRPDAGYCPFPFAYTVAGGYVGLPELPAASGVECGFDGNTGFQGDWPLAVNDADVIVGAYDVGNPSSFNFHAVRWTPK